MPAKRPRRSRQPSEPLYLSLTDPGLLNDVIGGFKIRKHGADRFEVVNIQNKSGRPEVIGTGKTPELARKAAYALALSRARRRVLEADFVRKVLLRGLKVHETGQRWLVSEAEFRQFLARIRARRLPIFGIEGWKPTRTRKGLDYRLQTIEIASLHSTNPEDPGWYLKAFLSVSEPGLLYYATVGVPEEQLDRFGRTHGAAD